MVDVKIIYSDRNRKFEIIRVYDGLVLYKSGKYKNYQNAQLGVEIKFRENPNWVLVDPSNVRIVHK